MVQILLLVCSLVFALPLLHNIYTSIYIYIYTQTISALVALDKIQGAVLEIAQRRSNSRLVICFELSLNSNNTKKGDLQRQIEETQLTMLVVVMSTAQLTVPRTAAQCSVVTFFGEPCCVPRRAACKS